MDKDDRHEPDEDRTIEEVAFGDEDQQTLEDLDPNGPDPSELGD